MSKRRPRHEIQSPEYVPPATTNADLRANARQVVQAQRLAAHYRRRCEMAEAAEQQAKVLVRQRDQELADLYRVVKGLRRNQVEAVRKPVQSAPEFDDRHVRKGED